MIATDVLKESILETNFTCIPIETTKLSSIENPKIIIDSPIKVEPSSLFGKPYTTYQIKVEELNSNVRRRFSDFDWLYQILSHLFVGNIIPKLEKKYIGDRFSEEFLQSRIEDMTLFLQFILNDSLLKSSQIIFDFLTVEDYNDFTQKKNTYDKIKKPSNLLQIKSVTGEEKSIVNNDSEQFVLKIKFNSDVMINHYNNICEKFELITEEMKNISNHMNDISNIFSQISKNEFFFPKKMCDCYNNLENHMKNWSELIQNQRELINIMKNSFKFFSRENSAIKEFHSKVELQKSNYYKGEEKLKIRKQSLFDKGDPMKWELKLDKPINFVQLKENKEMAFIKMIPKETENIYQSKLIYGFYNYRIINQYNLIKDYFTKCNLELFNNYFSKQKNFLETFNNDILNNISFLDNNENQ